MFKTDSPWLKDTIDSYCKLSVVFLNIIVIYNTTNFAFVTLKNRNAQMPVCNFFIIKTYSKTTS